MSKHRATQKQAKKCGQASDALDKSAGEVCLGVAILARMDGASSVEALLKGAEAARSFKEGINFRYNPDGTLSKEFIALIEKAGTAKP